MSYSLTHYRFAACSLLAATALFGCGNSNKPETGKSLNELFPGTAVAFPPQASKLTIGVSEGEAKKLIPDIFAAEYQELKLPDFGSKVQVSALFGSAESDGKWLRHVTLQVPAEAGLIAAEAQWGKANTVEVIDTFSKEKQSHHGWFNSASHLRALATPHPGYPDVLKIEVGEYLVPKLVAGSKGELSGFAIVGASAEAIQKQFGERFTTREVQSIDSDKQIIGRLALAPFGLTSNESIATIAFEGTRATGYQLRFNGLDTVSTKLLTDALDEAFGVGKPGKLEATTMVYASGVGAALKLDKGSHLLIVGTQANSEVAP